MSAKPKPVADQTQIELAHPDCLPVIFTRQEAEVCLALFDVALRAQGLTVAQNVVILGQRVQEAINGAA